MPPKSMVSVTLVADFLSGLRKNDEFAVGNDPVSLHVIRDNSETIVGLMVETIVAKKGIPILSSKYAHDGWRDIDLTDHTSHSLWLEASGSQEKGRYAVVVDRNQVSPAQMYAVVSDKTNNVLSK